MNSSNKFSLLILLVLIMLFLSAANSSAQVVPRAIPPSQAVKSPAINKAVTSAPSAAQDISKTASAALKDLSSQMLPIDKELDCNLPDAPGEITLSPAYLDKVTINDQGECRAEVFRVSQLGSLDSWIVIVPYLEQHGQAMCALLYDAINRGFSSENINGYLSITGRKCMRIQGDGTYEGKQYMRYVSSISLEKNLNLKQMSWEISTKLDYILKIITSLMSFLHAPY